MKTNDPRADLSSAQVISWAAVSSKIQDKFSIEDQLKLERDWCQKVGATLVDELVVRGFSRDYWTLADVIAASAHDPDMEAFARLQTHIRNKDFTIFLCFDADRFGRTESLILEVLGRVTRDCKALVYTLFDGVWMDEETAPMIGLLKAHKAQADVTKLKGYRATGMDNRAQVGKSTTAIMPMFHKRIRNATGKETGVILNEDLRSLWTDFATLILRGVSWEQMERALFEEFGHGEHGHQYRANRLRDAIFMPSFWGTAALNYRHVEGQYVQSGDPWVWDAHVPPPPGVTVYRDKLPAVYSGQWAELGERVKSELWRRHRLRGKGTSGNTYRFHGLVVCDECGYSLSMLRNIRGAYYMRCRTRDREDRQRRGEICTQTKYVSAKHIQAYLHAQVEKATASENSVLFEGVDTLEPLRWRITEEERQLARLRKHAESLIRELADSPDNVRPLYRQQIQEASLRIEQTTATLDGLQLELGATESIQLSQADNLEFFRSITLDEFWDMPDTVIHQRLSLALGNNQLVVRDGLIVGVKPSTSHYILSARRRSPLID